MVSIPAAAAASTIADMSSPLDVAAPKALLIVEVTNAPSLLSPTMVTVVEIEIVSAVSRFRRLELSVHTCTENSAPIAASSSSVMPMTETRARLTTCSSCVP